VILIKIILRFLNLLINQQKIGGEKHESTSSMWNGSGQQSGFKDEYRKDNGAGRYRRLS
jgi:hypothetical protein